jgi:hypothetical protein
MVRKRHEPRPGYIWIDWYARIFAGEAQVSARLDQRIVRGHTLEMGSMGEAGEVEFEVGELGPILRPPFPPDVFVLTV